MTVNANPLIRDERSDTIAEISARLDYISQWAEADEDNRALQQDLRMLRGAVLSLDSDEGSQKNLAQSV